MEPRIALAKAGAGAMKAMLGLETHVRQSGLEEKLLHLVRMRASQINGCAYCLDMHSKDARALGETEQRLYALDAWRETPFYSARERTALEWTESLTRIAEGHVPDEVFRRARAEFSEQELVDLALAVVAINGWNRLAIAFRSVPGSYQPGQLWGVVVAEHLGFSHTDALALGKAVSGLNAQSKGRRLGIHKPSAEPPPERFSRKPRHFIDLLGRAIPAEKTKSGMRVVLKGQTIRPPSVQRYLESKFGENLPTVEKAMKTLAAKFTPEELAGRAYGLYELFRPEIPSGVRGWGAAGTLDLQLIGSLGPKSKICRD